MSDSIYNEALCTVTEALEQPDNSVIFGHNGLNELKKLLEQARKQEQEHIEYSKKVQEQFSNDTKRIGELESRLIKQEKLLELYEELVAVKDDLLSCCEVRDLDYFDTIDMQSDLEQQIVEVEK